MGLVMALLAFLLVIVVGNFAGGGTVGGGAQVQVIVAANPIAFRTTIAPTDLTTKGFVQADVPPGSFLASQKSSVVGSVAELSIDKGQPLTQNMLAKNANDVVAPTTSYLPLPTGWVAYTMPTSELQGVAGYPQVGDYITVIASADLTLFSTGGQQSGPPRFVAKTIYTNLRIIRIGPAGGTSATASSQQGGLSSSLTVEMTQCDAEFMTWLQAKTTLKYTLESYHDYAPQPTAADSACPTIAAAQGVGPREVDGRWHFSAIG
ncbi:MAG TPA: Flp pilus assembly protein CpaB [Candidatus Dormibacteraeota bacterium]